MTKDQYLQSIPAPLRDRFAQLITKELAYDMIKRIMDGDYADLPGVGKQPKPIAIALVLTVAESYLANGGYPLDSDKDNPFEDDDGDLGPVEPKLTPSFGRENTPKVV